MLTHASHLAHLKSLPPAELEVLDESPRPCGRWRWKRSSFWITVAPALLTRSRP